MSLPQSIQLLAGRWNEPNREEALAVHAIHTRE